MDEVFGELHEVDVMPGMVIRPGDTLVVSATRILTIEQGQAIRELLQTRMPELAGIVVLDPSLTVSAVYRPNNQEI